MPKDFLTDNDVEAFAENLSFDGLGDRISCQESMLDLKLGQTGILLTCLPTISQGFFYVFLLIRNNYVAWLSKGISSRYEMLMVVKGN